MVTICTKKFCQPTIQDIIMNRIRKKNESDNMENFFNKLKDQRDENSFRILSGTAVPNSTFKRLHKENSSSIKLDESENHNDNKLNQMNDPTHSSSIKSLKQIRNNEEEKSTMSIKVQEKTRTSSLISGTSTLEELIELKDLLHRSSYVPKQAKTRRPTIEKIKSAIEKEKQILIDKNESTINDSIELSDASTTTERSLKKHTKKTKKSSNTSKLTNNASKPVGSGKPSTKGKKIKRKHKIIRKIDVEIQCTIYKDQ